MVGLCMVYVTEVTEVRDFSLTKNTTMVNLDKRF